MKASDPMNEQVIEVLNPITLPLWGSRLIEASAGTGKTFTIGLLYIRLLLGLGKKAAFPRPLRVEEILVVTFTEASIEELRSRIRHNIHQMILACNGCKKIQEPFFFSLLEEIGDVNDASNQLREAEQQMDKASIYTIHGFCHRMLTQDCFESGMLFEQTLVQNELPIRRQACADFWRRHFYPLPIKITRLISQEWSSPEALLSNLDDYLSGDLPVLRHPPKDKEKLLIRHEKIVAFIDRVKIHWKRVRDTLEALICQSGADKRIYSKKNLPNWLGKVNEWAMKETLDYQLPKALNKFRQSILLEKTKEGNPPIHELFIAIDELFSSSLTLNDLIITRAISEIRRLIQVEKRHNGTLGFDDLIKWMGDALQDVNGEKLAQVIRQRYPVAMIDEFQDTDPQQYRIFQKLYIGQSNYGLLLIGDPKQAIYSFRGADIFTYMRARSEVNSQYTINTNWRSSPTMVASINRLFCQLKNPFLFSQIPFIEVTEAEKNQGLGFELYNQLQPGMRFWLQQGEGVGISDHQKMMARVCATQIRDWLLAGQRGKAWLCNGQYRQPVEASNIAVLVRNKNEGALVRSALSTLSIPSVYRSNSDSIFNTQEAKDLLLLLRAVLEPEQEPKLRSAMATNLIGLDALTLFNLYRDQQNWDALINQFHQYHMLWNHLGVLPMLREVMKEYHLGENLIVSDNGARRLTDVMHLGELLQESSMQLSSKCALVLWLENNISQSNPQSDNQQLRLESDLNLVQVLTIHKSKGLEFDLVWLPFFSYFRQKKQALYHDRHSLQLILDLHLNKDSLSWEEEERLSEDLRLLYVALTRSVYHSSIGISPLIQGKRKKKGYTDLHHSALGYLVQAGKAGNSDYLYACLQRLAVSNILISKVETINEKPLKQEIERSEKLAARYFNRQIKNPWQVTSYTALGGYSEHLINDFLPQLGVNSTKSNEEKRESAFTPHTFPRGIESGTFLHRIFETLDFTHSIDKQWLLKRTQEKGFSDDWQPALLKWLQLIIATPLNESRLTLGDLSPKCKRSELQFHLPIKRLLQAHELDQLVKRYDPLSARCQNLDFEMVKGMLTGFIDLVFLWQKKYYLLDYKSNWLGEDSTAYSKSKIEEVMIKYRYDLQYQLYSLALHRYLQHRVVNYEYQRHFGGIIYLFLRGVDSLHLGNGIFTCRPRQELIKGMDVIFGIDPLF